jgi:hypothetical protein
MTLVELMGYVKDAGGLAAPIFAILFWLERNERLDAQKELREVAENSATAMVELKAMVAQLSAIFDHRSGSQHRTNPLTRERAARGTEFVATTEVQVEIG